MTERIAVGTPVTVKDHYWGIHEGKELVVLSHDCNKDGYGIGPVGNDPTRKHNSAHGWLYYPASYVTIKESKAVTFKKGDRVEFITDYPATYNRVAKGDTGTVRTVSFDLITVDVTSGKSKGTKETVFPRRLKLAAEPVKPAMKVGDKVRFSGGNPDWEGVEGILEGLKGEDGNYNHKVRLTTLPKNPRNYAMDIGRIARLSPDSLTLVEEAKQEFQKGDKVRLITRYKEHTARPIEVGDTAVFVAPYSYDKALVEVTMTSGNRNGATVALFPKRIELVEEVKPLTLNGFTVGDKVRYTQSLWKNLEGTVAGFNTGYVDVLVTKLPDNPSKYSSVVVGKTLCETVGGLGISTSSLEKIEPPFTFEDIQVGDKIRRTQTFKGGATETREGTVTRKASWYVEDNDYIVAYDYDTKDEAVTLELLNRPEPVVIPEPEPVKEPWETAKKGDRLVVKNNQGVTRVLTKQKSGGWDALLLLTDGTTKVGITRSDESVKSQLTYENFNVGKPQFIKA